MPGCTSPTWPRPFSSWPGRRAPGVCHVAGTDAISRYELGVLIAARDGLDQAALPVGLRAATGRLGALDVRLDSAATQAQLNTRLRGAREFLAPPVPD